VWLIIAGSIGMAVFVCSAAGLLGRLGVRVRPCSIGSLKP
jgi:hypothetical protein